MHIDDFTEQKKEFKEVLSATEMVPEISNTIQMMQKDITKYIKADEVFTRLKIVYNELTDKID